MEITTEQLRSNGWEWLGGKDYGKRIRDWFAIMDFQTGKLTFDATHLPRVRTMEQLSQLEWLLADTVAGTIETLPEPLRTLAPAIDRAIEELLPRANN